MQMLRPNETMNAHDILFYGNRTLLHSLERVPPNERNSRGVVGWWSAREAMAHLAIFEAGLAQLLESFLGGAFPELLSNMDSSKNDELVAQKKDQSFDELLDEYKASHARVMELIQKISPEKLREVGTIPWYGGEYSLDDFIVYTFYGHKREHAARFEAFGDRLEGRG
jgi:uncharacterized damage-inducible protein DinB